VVNEDAAYCEFVLRQYDDVKEKRKVAKESKEERDGEWR
jgi:hypothetical protein